MRLDVAIPQPQTGLWKCLNGAYNHVVIVARLPKGSRGADRYVLKDAHTLERGSNRALSRKAYERGGHCHTRREKRRIIGATMPTRYVGLFCPDRHFNVVGTYEVKHPYAPILVQRIWDNQAQCEQCGKIFSFQQGDVAHSNFPDGRDARYPHKLAAASHA